jgi:(2Fe-2S) ferredoxin
MSFRSFLNRVLPGDKSSEPNQNEPPKDDEEERVLSLTEKERQRALFPEVNLEVDGDDCKEQCSSCTLAYPPRFKQKSGPVFNSVNPFQQHLVVATGKKDWRKKVEMDSGSIFEKLSKLGDGRKEGRLIISASNIPVPESDDDSAGTGHDRPTSVLLLPLFKVVNNVTPSNVSDVLSFLAPLPIPPVKTPETLPDLPAPLTLSDSPHDYVILLCSHGTRDARCGQSAPLIASELTRHLRPLGLARDLDDTRPGGAAIYFVNHVGGHKFAANVIIYRRKAQEMIWLARVTPKDVEGVVKFTLLQGKVVNQGDVRGGWNKEGLTSW